MSIESGEDKEMEYHDDVKSEVQVKQRNKQPNLIAISISDLSALASEP